MEAVNVKINEMLQNITHITDVITKNISDLLCQNMHILAKQMETTCARNK